MQLDDFLDAGSDIFNAVSKAVENNDYSHLSDTIKDRVGDLGAQISQEVASAAGYVPKNQGSTQKPRRYQSAYEGQDFRTVESSYHPENDSANSGNSTPSGSGSYTGTGSWQSGSAHQNNSAGKSSSYRYENGRYYSTNRAEEPIKARKTVQQTGNLRRSMDYGSLNRSGTGSRNELVPADSHFLQRSVSPYSGTGRKIIGLVGGTLSGLGAAASLVGILAGGVLGFGVATAMSAASLVVSGGLTGVFAALGISGGKHQKLVEKYFEYGEKLGDAEYFAIEDLARATGNSSSQVRKDVLEMKRVGLLPYMAMDQQKNTVMLTENAYGQYQQAEMSRKEREAKRYMKNARKGTDEEVYNTWSETASSQPVGYQPGADAYAAQNAGTGASGSSAASQGASGYTSDTAKKNASQKKDSAQAKPLTEAERIAAEGEKYAHRIRYINDLIPDGDEDGMSEKLYRLEDIMRRIFEQVKKQPESAKDMRRMMDYYLPTTEKLLNAYVELDKQPEIGQNITSTKKEIAQSMDTINDAFEKMFDDMFRDVAWDISSDISVMKTMMAQDGLTQE